MANKISLLLSAANNISSPTEAATKSVGELRTAVSETNSSLKGLNTQQRMVTRFKGLSEQLNVTKQKLSGAKTEVVRLQAAELSAGKVVKQHAVTLKNAEKAVLAMAEAHGAESEQVIIARNEVSKLVKEKSTAERALKKERTALKLAEKSSEQLTSSYSKQSKELGGLRRDMGAAGLNVKALGAEELRLAKKTKQANSALEQQAAKLKNVQTIQNRMADRKAQKGELVGQAVGVIAQAAPLVMAGKRAVEYENTFADVKKVVNFSSPEEEAQYRTKMMKLAGDLGVKQEGIADIVTAAGQSGIEKDQLLAFAESATKMSVAWDVSADEAGSTLATWRAAMGLTQDKALDLADATNHLSNNMNAKAKDIAGVMVRQGSTAMGAGLSANETAALAASLIAGGAKEDTAGTALKNIAGALTAGYSATGSQKSALNKIGFDPEELASSMQKDAKGTLLGVLRELQAVSVDERGAVISQLFGSEIKGAVSKLVTTLDDPANGLVSAFGKVAKEAERSGSVNDEYANRAKTRGHTLAQLSTKFDRMTITLGDRLLPVIDAVVPPLMTVVDCISDFAEESPKLASGLLGVVASMTVLKAGAIAFKLAKLTMGNGADRFRLGRSRLSGSTDQTTQSANRASNALDRMNRRLSGLGSNGNGRDRGEGRTRSRRTRGRENPRARTRPSPRPRRRSRSRLGRLVGGVGSLVGGISNLFGSGSMPEQVMAGSFAARSQIPDNSQSRGRGKFGRMAASVGGVAALSMFSGPSSASEMAMIDKIAGSIGGSVKSALLPIVNAFSRRRRLSSGIRTLDVSKASKPATLPSNVAPISSAISPSNTAPNTSTTSADLNMGSLVGIIGELAMSGADMAGMAGDVVGAIPTGLLGNIAAIGGKFFKPLDLALQGVGFASAVSSGDSEQIGGTVGDMAGGLGGAVSGGMAGAAIGSVVPIIGTAIGGLIGSVLGGLGGGEVGEWAGSQIGSWFSEDKTEQSAPAAIAEKAKQLQQVNKQINFSPVIQITPSGNPSHDRDVGSELLERMKVELSPMLLGNADVSSRSDGSLSDRSDT